MQSLQDLKASDPFIGEVQVCNLHFLWQLVTTVLMKPRKTREQELHWLFFSRILKTSTCPVLSSQEYDTHL